MLIKYFVGKVLQENLPNMNQKNCINFYSKTQRCTQCRDACPIEAITINSKNFHVDEKHCNRCGICKAICPSQAIEFGKKDEIKAIRQLQQNEIIVVGCNQEGNQGNVTFPCLNGLHKEYLAAFLLALKDKKAYFNLCKCEDCCIEEGSECFKNSLQNAITFIKNLNFIPEVELVFCQENLPQYANQTISRRDLFTLFKTQSTNIVSEMVDDAVGKESTFTARDLILEYIDGLSEQVSENIEIHQEESLFTNWQIDACCNSCGLCQTMCPSKAWKVEKQKGCIMISHSAKRCMSCGLCADICPQKALFKDNFSTGLLTGFILKKETSLNVCKQCAKEYVPNTEDEGLCNICEKRRAVKQSIL